jgi:hypothetical protein
MQHKSQPSLLINARLRHPILIGTRGFAWLPTGRHKAIFNQELIDFKGLIDPALQVCILLRIL